MSNQAEMTWLNELEKEQKAIKQASANLDNLLTSLFSEIKSLIKVNFPFSKLVKPNCAIDYKHYLLFSTNKALKRSKHISSIDFNFGEFNIRLFYNKNRGEIDMAKWAEKQINGLLLKTR